MLNICFNIYLTPKVAKYQKYEWNNKPKYKNVGNKCLHFKLNSKSALRFDITLLYTFLGFILAKLWLSLLNIMYRVEITGKAFDSVYISQRGN